MFCINSFMVHGTIISLISRHSGVLSGKTHCHYLPSIRWHTMGNIAKNLVAKGPDVCFRCWWGPKQSHKVWIFTFTTVILLQWIITFTPLKKSLLMRFHHTKVYHCCLSTQASHSLCKTVQNALLKATKRNDAYFKLLNGTDQRNASLLQ